MIAPGHHGSHGPLVPRTGLRRARSAGLERQHDQKYHEQAAQTRRHVNRRAVFLLAQDGPGSFRRGHQRLVAISTAGHLPLEEAIVHQALRLARRTQDHLISHQPLLVFKDQSCHGGRKHSRKARSVSLQQEFCYWVVSVVWCILEIMVVMAVRADQSLVCGNLSGGHSDDKGRRARRGKACYPLA